MRLYSLILTVCFVAALTVSGAAVADDLSPEWLIGQWAGEQQLLGDRPYPLELTVKSDGTFTGEIVFQVGLTKLQDGKWKIAGDTVRFDYRTDIQGRAGRSTTSATWTLKRNGEDLEGTGFNHTNSRTYRMILKKRK